MNLGVRCRDTFGQGVFLAFRNPGKNIASQRVGDLSIGSLGLGLFGRFGCGAGCLRLHGPQLPTGVGRIHPVASRYCRRGGSGMAAADPGSFPAILAVAGATAVGPGIGPPPIECIADLLSLLAASKGGQRATGAGSSSAQGGTAFAPVSPDFRHGTPVAGSARGTSALAIDRRGRSGTRPG